MTTAALLETRRTTHGDFSLNAIYGQDLRSLFRSSSGWSSIPPIQREALDMIACKLSRILSGQATFDDHWKDIAGYAALAEKACVAQLHQDIDRQFGVDLQQETT